MSTGLLQLRWATCLALMLAAALALPAAGEAAAPGSISGTISGAGVGGLTEAEACAEGLTPGSTEFSCAKSGPGGIYTIPGLIAGSYSVWLGSPLGANYVSQYYDGVQSFESATPVSVMSGTTTPNIDATLEIGATISGFVKAAATGMPVANVEVCAFGTSENGFGCGETNGVGGYEILGLPAGTYNLEFFTYETEQNLLSQPYELGLITLAAGQERTGVNAALRAGAELSGTVRAAATGAPLKGVTVCLTEAGEAWPLGCLETPASGRYVFLGLWTGFYKVVFSPEASELEEGEYWELVADPFPTQWWNGQPTFVAATPIDVTAGTAVSGIDGSLGPGPVVAPQPVPQTPPATAVVKPKRKPLRCHKGQVKRKLKGKARCVNRPKPKRHHRKHHPKPHKQAKHSR